MDILDLFGLEELQQLQDKFSSATGTASLITRPDGTPVTQPSNFCRLCSDIIRSTEGGMAACMQSDATLGAQNPTGPTVMRCLSVGLWDAGTSITVGGRHVGSWLVGQVRYPDVEESSVRAFARQIGADETEFMEALDEVPVMTREQFDAIADFLFVMAAQLSEKAYQNHLKEQLISEVLHAEELNSRITRSAEARLRLIDLAASCTLDELLEGTLDELEQLTGSAIGFYHFVDSDQASLRLQNWSTRTKSDYCNAEGKGSHYSVSSAGVWADCLRQGKSVVHNDYASLPGRKGLPEGHAALIRELTVPVIRAGKVVAIVGVGNKPTDYDSFDVETVERLSELVWDVTERKKAEEELRDTATRLSLALSATGEGFYDLNLRTGQAAVTPAYLEMLGDDQTQLTFDLSVFADRIHRDDRDEVLALIDSLVRGEADEYRTEFRLLHSEGRWIWVHSVGRVVERGTDGRALRMLGGHTDVTESRQISQALQRAQAVAKMGIWRLDLASGRASGSPETRLLYGEDPEAVSGDLTDVIARAVHPDDRAIVETETARAISECVSRPMEYRVVLPDGSIRWVHGEGEPETNAAGKVVALTGFVQDITERKLAEEALRERNELLAQAQRIARIGHYVLDARTGAWTSSESLDEIFGIDDAYVRSVEGWLGVVHAEDRADMGDYVQHHVLAKCQPFDREYRITRVEDGEARWVHGIGTLECDADGTVLRMFGVIQDITETKLAEQALIDSELGLQRAQAVAHVGSWVWHVETNTLEWSDEMYRIFGIDRSEFTGVLGDVVARAIHPDDRAAVELANQRVEREGKPIPLEYRVVRPDGTVRVVWAEAGRAERDEQGRVVTLSGIVADITDRKLAEQALIASTEELSRSNTELEQFAYVASHDLREPLRMVTSYTQLLKKRYAGQLDSDADDFIGFAVDGAARMESLIQDLLEYSRVGSRGSEFSETDLEQTLMRSLKNLEVAVEEAAAEVTHDPMPSAVCDGSQVGLVFQNLIANSLKFRGEDHPKVHVGARLDDGEWVFSVSDNGLGIGPEYFERIFVIFQRLLPRDVYEGSGMGLAICRRIVERHGGRIWVESEPGSGATFYFTIPVAQ